MFIGGNGIAAYSELFSLATKSVSPFAVVLQDHGCGGNYDRFGAGGQLEREARHQNLLPHYILVADNTRPWKDYRPAPNPKEECGGMHAHKRFLWKRVYIP